MHEQNFKYRINNMDGIINNGKCTKPQTNETL